MLCAHLRTAQAEAAIVVRGDAGFCRDTLMTWCEQRRVVDKAEWLPGQRGPQSGTIRSRILKVAVAVRVTARKVWLRFSSTYPHRELFESIARLLTDRRPRGCPG